MAADEARGLPELRNPFTGQTIRFLEESAELLVTESSHEAREFFLGLFAALRAASNRHPGSASFDFADYADEFRPA